MSAEKKSSQPIPGFKLIEKLGQGGMGAVYKAIQTSLDREVALKVMPISLASNPEFRERFFREARAAGRLNHPNIVQGIDAGEAGQHCWIAMELVTGGTVANRLRKDGKLQEKEALSVVLQIARAIAHASEAGIVHRDIKPENFLISADGVVKLCDLGIAKAPSDVHLTQDGKALGTPLYISPEQAKGERNIDVRADIYSLGVSWYHMLCGQPPFDGTTPAVIMTKHLNEQPPSLLPRVPGLAHATVMVIDKMMAKDRNKRYANAKELLEDLDCLSAGKPPRHAGMLNKAKGAAATSSGQSHGHGHAPAQVQGGQAKSGKTTSAQSVVKGKPAWLMPAIGAGIAAVAMGALTGMFGSSNPPPPANTPRVTTIIKQPAATGAKPEPTAQPKNVKTMAPEDEKKAQAEWVKLEKYLESQPPFMHAQMWRRFAEKYGNTTIAKKAADKATEIDAKIQKENEETMLRESLKEYSGLSDTDNLSWEYYSGMHPEYNGKEAEGKKAYYRMLVGAIPRIRNTYVDFLNTYPNTPQTEKVKARLKQIEALEKDFQEYNKGK